MKVLVVDDVRFFRYQLERLLTGEGHRVWLAGSGAQALQMLQTERDFDTVITDLFMPAMDGFRLFTEAHELLHSMGAHVPKFVLITTLDPRTVDSPEGIVYRALHQGFADVISKPLNRENVVSGLEHATHKQTAC